METPLLSTLIREGVQSIVTGVGDSRRAVSEDGPTGREWRWRAWLAGRRPVSEKWKWRTPKSQAEIGGEGSQPAFLLTYEPYL